MLVLVMLSVFRAESKIVVKNIDCLGNLTSFNYVSSSGFTISSISWDFGDGNSSVNIKTNHIYKSTGTFKVKVTAVLSNGNTEDDTATIKIVGLPLSKLQFLKISDSCFLNNDICFSDNSLPAVAGQTIQKRILLWADGKSDVNNVPGYGDKMCHHYSNIGAYKVTMEVTDKFGCKDITNYTIHVVGSVNTDLVSNVSFAGCNRLKVCFTNKSTEYKPVTVNYLLKLDSTANDSSITVNNSKCIYKYKTGNIRAILMASTSEGCADSIIKDLQVQIDTLPKKLVLSDSLMCYSSDKDVHVVGPSYTADAIQWFIDKAAAGNFVKSGYGFIPNGSQLLPGKHTLSCVIIRGSCTTNLSANFIIIGPVAKFGIINQYQCSTLNQVTVYNQSEYLDTIHSSFFWKFNDINAAKCTTNYIKDINLYGNCNYAIGSYHKHVFSQFASNYQVKLIVRDSTSGCIDSTFANIDVLKCTKLFNQINYQICQGDLFYKGYQGGINDPYLFSLDTGKSWKKFPSIVNAPYLGLYKVGFIFRNYKIPWVENIGTDSIKVHADTAKLSYDTIYKKDFLSVYQNKTDSVYFRDYTSCRNNKLTVYFKNKLFYKGEKIEINWGDTIIAYSFDTISKVDSIQHQYTDAVQMGNMFVTLYSTSGCYTTYSHPIGIGRMLSVSFSNALCTKQKICAQATIVDNKTNIKHNSLKNAKVLWLFDDSIQVKNNFSACTYFNFPGKHYFYLEVTDSTGCKDSVKGQFDIQELKAHIEKTPNELYCTELRQFFDSSYVYNPFDPIKKYNWDFGTNTFLVVQKDPFISFNSSADSVRIRLAVETDAGCKDTTEVSIQLIGGKPFFTIKDTIACGSLNALFINKSKKCRSFIWEFGDSAHTSLDVNDTQSMRFNYTKPGKYKIKLIGIDTIYNPSTGNTYYCTAVFPENGLSRTVTVLPTINTNVYSKDTICLGDSIVFWNKKIPYLGLFKWRFGDGYIFNTVKQDSIKYLYSKLGTYQVNFQAQINANNACVDSFQKYVVVTGINADFAKDPNSIAPNFIFNNLSQPATARLYWDFGHPESGNLNHSEEQNPMHQYFVKKKEYLVCLKATSLQGCIDSICKPFIDNDSASIIVYNVFTPGNDDNKNDQYDILVEGENLYDLSIYNRWGVLVYESKKDYELSDNMNWNGKVFNSGAECPMGTYYYIFKYRIPILSKEIKLVNGVIQLIR